MSFGLFEGVCLICCQVRLPPIGQPASSKVMSGVISPSTTSLTASLNVSLYSTSVWDLTFPICVLVVWSLCILEVGRLVVGLGVVCKPPGLFCSFVLC